MKRTLVVAAAAASFLLASSVPANAAVQPADARPEPAITAPVADCNLRESTDLMGYGWIGDAPDPLFSQCDLDAIAYLFGPLLAGEDPASPGPSTLQPTFDCAGT